MRNWFIAGIVGMLLFFVVYTIVMHFVFPHLWVEMKFQDMYAGLAALFSGFAFLGVIYAVLLQREELNLQREELRLTRAELVRTADAQEKSELALTAQATSSKVTATLNGLSAILQHQNTLLGMTNDGRYGINEQKFQTLKADADKIIDEIKKLIDGK